MKVLYYSVVLNSKHGGSNHASQFVKYATAHSDVKELLIFPKQSTKQSSSKVSKKAWIKRSSLFLIPRFYRRNRHLLSDLISFIEEERPDVLIMRPDHNFLQLKRLKKLFPKMIFVAEINSSSFDESYSKIPFKAYFQRMERQTYSMCDLNYFVTMELRNQVMQEKIDLSRDFVVYNGTEPYKFSSRRDDFNYRKEIGISDKSFVIGYMGTLDIHKKMLILIEAFSILTSNRPDLILLIVGDGPDRESIENQITKLGLNARVIITGWVDYATIENYLFAMDIAVHHHSNSYCCPLKIFDYMAAGLPTIAPDISFIHEEFETNVHLVVTQPNVDSIYESILGFLDKPDWAKNVGYKGRDFVINNFTWEKSASQIIDRIVMKLNEKN